MRSQKIRHDLVTEHMKVKKKKAESKIKLALFHNPKVINIHKFFTYPATSI